MSMKKILIVDDLASFVDREKSILNRADFKIYTATDRAKVARCQANAYITKPIRPVEFLEKVSQFLDIPERQSYRVLLKVKVKGKTTTEPFFCSSRNISVTGLLIETDKILEKGDVISCSFFLPKSEIIVTDAEE
jgi:hypothetical protein